MAKFKVGDKVRINDVDRIHNGDFFWRNGDVTEVMEVDDDGDIFVKATRGIFREETFLIVKREFDYIEKVAETPTKLTKSQRIEALEKQVAELKLEIEALKISEIAGQVSKALWEEKSKTPNQKRKAIIDEAKAFVESAQRKQRDINCTTEGNEILCVYTTKTEFVVNDKKRTVVALIRYLHGDDPTVIAKGIAKCAPDDVFNADIGKAIALGRALGLDVTRFEQAVQPTEVVVGMIVKAKPESFFYDTPYTVEKIEDDRLYDAPGNGWIYDTDAIILDDTEAQYD